MVSNVNGGRTIRNYDLLDAKERVKVDMLTTERQREAGAWAAQDGALRKRLLSKATHDAWAEEYATDLMLSKTGLVPKYRAWRLVS